MIDKLRSKFELINLELMYLASVIQWNHIELLPFAHVTKRISFDISCDFSLLWTFFELILQAFLKLLQKNVFAVYLRLLTYQTNAVE